MPLNRCCRFLLALSIGVLSGCQFSGEHPEQSSRWQQNEINRCSDCLAAHKTNGWCEPCDQGFVALVPIDSRAFHDALDAHGHEVPLNTLQCQLCLRVADEDQFCPRCNHGFVAGMLYFSRLSWSLARGSLIEEPTCPGCKPIADSHVQIGTFPDRCPDCHSWTIGNRGFLAEDQARDAWKQLQRLVEALKREQKCGDCGLHGFFGFNCPNCGLEPIPDV